MCIIMTKLKSKIDFKALLKVAEVTAEHVQQFPKTIQNEQWKLDSFLVRALRYSSVHCKGEDKFRFYN